MTEPVAGIDPHQKTFTVGIVDEHGVEFDVQTFKNSGAGYADAIDLLTTNRVRLVGIEGSARWGAHVAVALAAAGFDAREVPASRTATQRRSRRLDKTDAVDAVSAARALQAEPNLGPAQALDAYDQLVAKIEAVLEHRRALVASRTLLLHHVGDQISKLPPEIRDELTSTGKIESRLRRLESIGQPEPSTPSGDYRLRWLLDFIGQDRAARREIRRLERLIDELLDDHGTSLREEPGIGPIAAATLLCEVGDPHRFATESKFARWCGTGAVALDPAREAVNPFATASTSAATAPSTRCSTSPRSPRPATTPAPAPTSPERPPKARRHGRPGGPTSGTSRTESSAECGRTNTLEEPISRPLLDKEACGSPLRLTRRLCCEVVLSLRCQRRARRRRRRCGRGWPSGTRWPRSAGSAAQRRRAPRRVAAGSSRGRFAP